MYNLTHSIRKRLSNFPKCLNTTKVPKNEKSTTTTSNELAVTESRENVKTDNEQAGSTKEPKTADTVEESLKSSEQVQLKSSISDYDVLSIYTDISKLHAIECHLNLLYRPFTCLVLTRCRFNLLEINSFLPNSMYEPDKHLALVVTRTNPTCSLKVYENGTIYCQAYSYESAALGIRRFMGTTEHLGYTPAFNNPKFNVVSATFCVPFGIQLQQLYEEYRGYCSYNPEIQPFLTYNIRNWTIKLIIFNMGYVYVLMSSQPRYTQKAISYILPILYRHRADHMSPANGDSNEPEACSGDVNFKLLWENAFQRAYQNKLKFN